MPEAPNTAPPTAAPDTDATDPAPAATSEPTTNPAPETNPETAKWQALSKKHEARATENAAKAIKYDEYIASQQTEQEKLAADAATARQEAADTAAELARLKAAVKHKLSEDDLELLGKGGTPEEIEARAEKLAARLAGITPPPVPPAPPANAQGNVGGGVHGESDPIKELDARIAEADKARNFTLAIQLKRERSALAGAKT